MLEQTQQWNGVTKYNKIPLQIYSEYNLVWLITTNV